MADDKKWYSLRVISGKERKIKERIDFEVDRSGWREIIPQVLVPTEKVYKIRGGKKVISERNILPGYILVEADPAHPEALHLGSAQHDAALVLLEHLVLEERLPVRDDRAPAGGVRRNLRHAPGCPTGARSFQAWKSGRPSPSSRPPAPCGGGGIGRRTRFRF